MPQDQGAKFIARNRAPRVQIEYDVEIYGAEKKIQLPFVMGVLADLSGKPAGSAAAGGRPQVPRDRRRQFRRSPQGDEAARGLSRCPNTLTGEGDLPSTSPSRAWTNSLPDAVARKVEPLRKLLEARKQLSNLLTYMDGKAGAEELMAKLLQGSGAAAGAGGGTQDRGAQAQSRAPARQRGDHTMADADQLEHRRRPRQPQRRSRATSTRCCKKEFRPKTGGRGQDRGRRRHAGRAGAAARPTGLRRRRQDDPGDHRPARPEAVRAGQPDPAPRGIPAAGGHLARPALSGQQHRNRRDAQDPGDEHLQEGARQDASRSSRAPRGIRARSSRRSTPTSIRCSAASRIGCLIGDY